MSAESAATILAAATEPIHHGQVRMAHRIEEDYTGKLIFVHGLGWHRWDDTRWVRDDGGYAERAVLDVLERAWPDAKDDKALRADVVKCESANGVAGVLALSRVLEPFAYTVKDLDADEYLLNTASGTLDLRTMTLSPHSPGDLITKVTRAGYRPGEGGKPWGEFLEQVLPGADVREFLQRFVGVGLLGRVQEQVLGILTGTGANGKGTFYKAVGHALGDYADTADPELFFHREGTHPTGQMDLLGKRWVVVSESDKNRKLAEATMKNLTGADTIKARYMRQDFVTFEPSHTPVLVTNHLPKVSGDDPALWRRMRVIPFDVVIEKADQDVHLDETLRLDADAVLTWAVEGYAAYVAGDGLREPEAVLVATEDYRKESDALARFIDDRCLVNPGRSVAAADVWAAWVKWCRDDDAEPGSQRALGQSLDRLGYAAGRGTGGGRRWRGFDLEATETTETISAWDH
jgi:putative DNA primase/helicase